MNFHNWIVIKKMAKNLIVYESPDKSFITHIGFLRISEYIYVQNLIKRDNGETKQVTLELATDNQQIRALRDFLNNLNLKEDD